MLHLNVSHCQHSASGDLESSKMLSQSCITHRASRRLAAHCRAAPWRSADPPIALRISLSSSKRTIFLCFLIFSWRLSNILALSSILNSSASRRCDDLCIYCMSLLLSSSSFSNRSCSWLISARTSFPLNNEVLRNCVLNELQLCFLAICGSTN